MKKTALLAFFLLAATAAASPAVPSHAFHFALRSSWPEADASVTSPEEVRLTFTEAPQDNSVSVRVIAPSGDPLATEDPAYDADDKAIVRVAIGQKLAAGKYTVSWRGIGDDGHAVRGDFAFTVTAQ